MKLTILTTLQDYWGGSELLFVSLINEAIFKGYKVQIVAYEQKELHPLLSEQINKAEDVILLKQTPKYNGLIDKGFGAIKAKIIKENLNHIGTFNPDFIICNQANCVDAAFNPIFYNFFSKTTIPFSTISHYNNDYQIFSQDDQIKIRSILNKAIKLYYVSQRNLKTLEHQISQELQNRSIIANHPFIKKFNYIPFPKNTETIEFASVARLECSYKGQDILIKILSKQKWSSNSWKLNFYGSGPDEEYLKELVKFYHLEDKIVFHGHVSNVYDIWKKCHILLMPSLGEGKPLALEEALICGRPAIVSDVAGNTELIEEDFNGYISSSYFIKPFEEAMEKAWQNKEQWEQMGKQGHERLMKTLDFNPAKTILNEVVKIANGKK